MRLVAFGFFFVCGKRPTHTLGTTTGSTMFVVVADDERIVSPRATTPLSRNVSSEVGGYINMYQHRIVTLFKYYLSYTT